MKNTVRRNLAQCTAAKVRSKPLFDANQTFADRLPQDFTDETVSLEHLTNAKNFDLSSAPWRWLANTYPQAEGIRARAYVTVLNAILTQRRAVFSLSRRSLQALLKADHGVGFKDQRYAWILEGLYETLLQLEKPSSRTDKTSAIYSVKDPQILAFLNLSPEEIAKQHQEALNFAERKANNTKATGPTKSQLGSTETFVSPILPEPLQKTIAAKLTPEFLTRRKELLSFIELVTQNYGDVLNWDAMERTLTNRLNNASKSNRQSATNFRDIVQKILDELKAYKTLNKAAVLYTKGRSSVTNQYGTLFLIGSYSFCLANVQLNDKDRHGLLDKLASEQVAKPGLVIAYLQKFAKDSGLKTDPPRVVTPATADIGVAVTYMVPVVSESTVPQACSAN